MTNKKAGKCRSTDSNNILGWNGDYRVKQIWLETQQHSKGPRGRRIWRRSDIRKVYFIVVGFSSTNSLWRNKKENWWKRGCIYKNTIKAH